MAAKLENRELTPEELQAASGSWNWGAFGGGASIGAFGIGGAVLCAFLISNPVGWAITAGGTAVAAAAGAGICGSVMAVMADDK